MRLIQPRLRSAVFPFCFIFYHFCTTVFEKEEAGRVDAACQMGRSDCVNADRAIKDLQSLIQARDLTARKSEARVKLGVCFLSGIVERGGARGLDWVTEKGSEMHEWREVSAGGSPSGRLIYPRV